MTGTDSFNTRYPGQSIEDQYTLLPRRHGQQGQRFSQLSDLFIEKNPLILFSNV